MVWKHLFLCLFGFSVSFLANSVVANEAIVGGVRAEINQFPYQVTLLIYEELVCGGGIITDHFILTAAHCVVESDGNFESARVFILAGTNDIRKTTFPAIIRRVVKISVPTEFTPPASRSTGDIAVLKMDQPLGLSKHRHLKALKLPTNKRELFHGRIAMVAGFGWDHAEMKNGTLDGSISDTFLKYMNASVLTNERCRQSYKNASPKKLCARTMNMRAKSGICNGDSGSPLVLEDTVIGVVSIGLKDCKEVPAPSLYTRVSNFLTFIYNAMSEKRDKRKDRYIRTFEFPVLR